jgi:hypothetical protein
LRVEGRGLRVEGGGLRVEGGGWRVEVKRFGGIRIHEEFEISLTTVILERRVSWVNFRI